MLMDSLFCRHCGTKRGEANFEPSYHLASNRGATGALPTSSLPLEGLYSFPTAGSFVGEPFREGGVASYSSRHFLRPEGGYGAVTNDFSWYPPAGPGDTYSGGTMSYGPPPGVPGVQPCGGYPYGDGAPLYQARPRRLPFRSRFWTRSRWPCWRPRSSVPRSWALDVLNPDGIFRCRCSNAGFRWKQRFRRQRCCACCAAQCLEIGAGLSRLTHGCHGSRCRVGSEC